MDRISDIVLIAKTHTMSGLGVNVPTGKTERTLVCTVSSVSARENFDGVIAGFRPYKQAKLADSRDYQGEDLCRIGTEEFEIYRTYETKDGGIELYLQRRSGVIGN